LFGEDYVNVTSKISEQDHEVEKSAIRKISMRIVPFIALMFFINFLDRTAISFAGPNGMTQDLGMTAAQFGFAAGIFFFGYIILEIPSNLALHKYGARRWLARIMVTWGIVALLFTWVSSVTGLYRCASCSALPKRVSSPALFSISAPGCPAATAPRSWRCSISPSR
jgi:sugar phosphate permease